VLFPPAYSVSNGRPVGYQPLEYVLLTKSRQMAERLGEKEYPRIPGGIDSLFAEGAIW
jgi:hypothetical protein